MVGDSVFGFVYEKQWEYENGFYLTSHSSRIAKSIAHWELYKRIVSLPGEIIECGVFKGASFVRWATFREMLESPYSRKIIGFDAFGAFPMSTFADDARFIKMFEEQSGIGISDTELDTVLQRKGFCNYELVKGNILETLPKYITANPQLRISMLHIDVDVYEPAKIALEQFFERIVPGGLLVLDDYGTVAGESNAVDFFLESLSETYQMEKLPYYKVPVFLVK